MTNRIFILLVSFWLFTSDSLACSVSDSFLRPTNYELVQSSASIILAKYDYIDDRNEAEMRAIEFLKGESKKTVLWKSPPSKNYQGASEPYDFSRARPGAYSGSCSASDFAAGKYYLIFQPGGIFSRTDEEVENEYSPWVMTVREYISLSPSQLKARMLELSSMASLSRYEKALLTDIELHFQTPSYAKNANELIEIWNSAWPIYQKNQKAKLVREGKSDDELEMEYRSRARVQSQVSGSLWALSKLDSIKAARVFSQLSSSVHFNKFAKQYSNYFESNPSVQSLNALLDAYERVNDLEISEYKKSESSWKLMHSIIDVAKVIDPTRMLELVNMSSNGEEIVRVIGSLPVEYQGNAISLVKSKLDSLTSNQDPVFDMLAKAGDPDILEWAKQSLYADLKHSRQAMRVFAFFPEKASASVVKKIIKEEEPELLYFLSGLSATSNNKKAVLIDNFRDSKQDFSKWIEPRLRSLEEQGDKHIRRWLDIIGVYPKK